jgi:integrase
MRMPLTDLTIRSLKHQKGKQFDITDKGYPGLTLRLSTNSKAWVFIWRRRGKTHRITIGRYPDMTLAQARETWRNMRTAVAAGKIPVAPAKRKPGDFLSVSEKWLAIDQAKNRSVKEVRRTIMRYCQALHGMAIADITKHDIRDVLHAVEVPAMRRRVFTRMRRLFTWARTEDYITSHPMDGLARPGADVKRERVLSDDELARVWRVCGQIGWPYGPVIQLLFLTGARRSEIAGLRWSEINDYGISLSAERTKTAVGRDVPLSSVARGIVDALPHIVNDQELVFPSTKENTPIANWSNVKKELDNLAGVTNWRLHDIRRTVATGLQRLGIPLQVTENILGHVGSRAGVADIYLRYGYHDEMKAALEQWGEYVAKLISGAAAHR